MPTVDAVENMIRDYYRAAADQLKIAARAAVSNHNGLTGSMRESEVGGVLRRLLPQRYALARGMVYGQWHRSHEADLMVWDAMNYPTINMKDDVPLCFAESVRAVIEVKSVWGERELKDIREKCRAVREIAAGRDGDLYGRVAALEEHAQHGVRGGGLRSQGEHEHDKFKPAGREAHHIPFVATVLTGGATFDHESLTSELVADMNATWPSLLLFLETGRVVFKGHEPDRHGRLLSNWITFCDAGDDALLLFASHLNSRVAQCASHTEEPFRLHHYCEDIIDKIPGKRVLCHPGTTPPSWEVHELKPELRLWRPRPT